MLQNGAAGWQRRSGRAAEQRARLADHLLAGPQEAETDTATLRENYDLRPAGERGGLHPAPPSAAHLPRPVGRCTHFSQQSNRQLEI